MPGTLLLDDLRDSVGEQLRQHVNGLVTAGQQALSTVPQVPDRDAILRQLQQHVDQVVQPVEQPALQVLGGAQQAAGGALQQVGQARDQVAQQLQQHVDDLTQQQPQTGLQSLVVPAPTPAPPPVGAADQSQPSIDTGGPPLPLDQTASDRVRGQSDAITRASASTGTPASVIAAIMDTEAGGPNSRSSQGASGFMQVLDQHFKPGENPFDPLTNITRGAEILADNFKRYGSWDKAAAAYFGAIDAQGNITGARDAGGTTGTGYVGRFLTNLDKYGGTLSGALEAGKQAVGGAASTLGTATRGVLDTASTAMNQSQFGDPQLTSDEAYAACGPAAAVRFAERFGRNPTLREATDLAKQVGWTSGGGMAGIASEQKLMSNLGIDTRIVGRDWNAFAKEATTGNPVTISTPGHYFFADGYNADTGAFHVGRSGLDLKGGAEWMTPQAMESLMGSAQGALFANNPTVPAKGNTAASNEPVTIAGQAPKAPLYVHGALQDATGNEPTDQGPTPIQSAADVVGRATEGARGAVGQVASDLGTAAQGAVSGAAQAVTGAVGQVASDIGTSAQDLYTSRAADLALRQGRTQKEQAEFTARQNEETDRLIAEQARRNAEPITPGSMAGNAWNMIVGATPAQGISWDDYRQSQDTKNQWIEQNNPANNLPVLGPVVGGLTSAIAQQLTDPLMVMTFGPTLGFGRAAGASAAEAVAGAAAERLSPAATRFLSTVAERVTTGGIVNGLQQALFEAEKTDATPQAVGQALLSGAALGAGIDLAAPAVATVVRRIGQTVIDRAGEIRPGDLADALRTRQRAEGINPFSPPPRTPAETLAANPYRLEQAAPTADARPLSTDEISDHFDALQQRHDEVAGRILDIQEQLAAGRGAQPDRPPWAAGYTNDALQTIARQHGVSAFEQNWWEKAGLFSGSGEVRENVGQSGLRGTGNRLQSPTQLRAEMRQLQAEEQHLLEAANDLTSATDAAVFYRPRSGAEPLPFGYPASDVRGAPVVEPARPVEPVGGREAAPGAGQGRAAPAADQGVYGTPEPPPYAPSPGPAGRPELGQAALPGFRAPELPQPERAVQQPLRMPRAAPLEGAGPTPELDRLNAMYEGKKPAPATSIPDRIQQVGDSLTRAFTDRQVDINRAQERYAANLGRPLRGDEMAAELQRLASDPAAQVKVDEGLKPAIQAVGRDYPALRNYVTLRSNVEIADNLATRTGKPEVGTDRLFSGGLTRDESVKAMQDLEQQLGPQRFATVQAAADQVTAFNKSLRERLVQAGVLDEGTAAQLEAQYPNWAKTRILDYMADPTGGQGAGTKLGLSDRGLRDYTLKGTERAREDPVASTVAYAHQVERMAMKNEAFNAFLKIDQASDKPMLREVPQSYSPTKNEVTMIGFVDGEKTKYVTDNKALGAAINGAGVMSTPEWTSAWQKVFRSFATSRNPVFLAGNAAVDIPTYVLRSSVREGGPQALPRILYELARGYGDAFQGLLQGEFRGTGTSEFLKGGGGQSGYFTGGEGQSKRAVAEMQRNNVFQISGWNDLGRLTKDLLTLHPVEALGERIELGPRVAAMRLAQRRGENATKAIIDGRTVTVDFSQGGTVTKYLNNFIPFFNVGFQGPAQVARAFRENPRAFVATVGTLLGVPSAAAEVWNRSDPQRAKDYADVPQYVKDQGVVVMLPGEAPVDKQGNRKPMYAVIKLREWAPFAAAAREATARVLGDDSRSWQDMAQSVGTGFSPFSSMSLTQAGTEPLAAIPVLPAAAQIAMNKDFFRNRTIVTQRSDENASGLSKTLAPAMQSVLDRAGVNAEIRPSAIDFMIRNQGAGVGGAALGASDLAAGQPSDVAGPTGMPVVGGLIGRFAGNQTGDELQRARDETLTTEGRQILRNNGITLTPGAVSSSINQIPINLEEETRYQQLTNRYIDEAIQRTAASSDFASKTQVGKQSLMDQAMQAARQKAGVQVLNTIAADEKQRRLKAKSTAPAAA